VVQDLSSASVEQMFSTETNVAGNYHPVTLLSLAWDYDRSKELNNTKGLFEAKAKAFLQTSLAMHLINGLLVYLLVFMLCGSIPLSGLVALLFVVHPLHVESVTWISGRKDVSYTLFFLASLATYYQYVKSKKAYWVGVSFLLFIPALLSKPAAVVLPVLLILFDLFEGRKLDLRFIIEKIVFVIPAVIIGLITIRTQTDSEAVAEFGVFSIWERIVFASYGFLTYIGKFFYPSQLSAFHPYPAKDELETIFYIFPFIALAIVALGVWAFRKNRKVFFSIFFYAINLALVLQFVTVGNAIIAERYSYVPYIGLSLLILWPLHDWLKTEKMKAFRVPALAVALLLCGAYAYAAKLRTNVWQSTYTLWTDVIEKYSNRVAKSYNNRGLYLKDNGDPVAALEDYNMGISIEPDNHLTFNSRGNVYKILASRDKEKREEYLERSVADLSKAIELRSDHYQSYNSRGLSYMDQKKYEEALADFNKALEIKPDHYKVYINRAGYYLAKEDFEQAIKDYNVYLAINPGDVLVQGGKAFALFRKGDFQKSLDLSNSCLRADP
jgi:tetratricopeptide (TPR) repeat protein